MEGHFQGLERFMMTRFGIQVKEVRVHYRMGGQARLEIGLER